MSDLLQKSITSNIIKGLYKSKELNRIIGNRIYWNANTSREKKFPYIVFYCKTFEILPEDIDSQDILIQIDIHSKQNFDIDTLLNSLKQSMSDLGYFLTNSPMLFAESDDKIVIPTRWEEFD